MIHYSSLRARKVIGIIVLAGGQGRRMGGQDKGWCLYGNHPCIELVLSQLAAQIAEIKVLSTVDSQPDFQIFISANRHLNQYHALGFDVITDEREGFCGPLAGIESVIHFQQGEALRILKKNRVQRWITCPVDSPDLPANYLKKMLNVNASQIAYAEQGGRKHFAHLSIPATQSASLSAYLDSGQRSIKHWLFKANLETLITAVHFSSTESNLLNLNTLNIKQA